VNLDVLEELLVVLVAGGLEGASEVGDDVVERCGILAADAAEGGVEQLLDASDNEVDPVIAASGFGRGPSRVEAIDEDLEAFAVPADPLEVGDVEALDEPFGPRHRVEQRLLLPGNPVEVNVLVDEAFLLPFLSPRSRNQNDAH